MLWWTKWRLESKDRRKREKAVRKIGESKDPRAFKPLLARLKDESPYVQQAAVEALGKIGDVRAVPALVVVFKGGFMMRKAAHEALQRIDSNWSKSEAAKQAIPTLVIALKDDDSTVREGAAEALGELGDVRVVQHLVAALKDVDHMVRPAVRKALERIDPNWGKSEVAKKAIPTFVAALKDTDSRVRAGTAEALGKMGDERVLEPLVATLIDEESWVREAVSKALDSIDPNWAKSEAAKQSVPRLVMALKAEKSSVREGAAKALSNIGDIHALLPLIAALKDEYLSVQTAAAKGLGDIGDKCAVQPLMSKLNEWGLKMSGDAAHEVVCEALKRIDPAWAKSNAAMQIIPRYVEALKDHDWRVREGAVKALGNVGNESGIQLLVSVLMDRDSDVRAATAKSLDKIDSTWSKSEVAKQAIPWIIDTAVKALLEIYSDHPQGFVLDGEGPYEALTVRRIRDIGTVIDRLGEMILMREVHAKFASVCRVFGAPRNLEFMWDGIGDWRG